MAQFSKQETTFSIKERWNDYAIITLLKYSLVLAMHLYTGILDAVSVRMSLVSALQDEFM